MKKKTKRKCQKKNQSCRSMRNSLIYSKKVGKVIDQREYKDKNQYPESDTKRSYNQNKEQNWNQYNLKRRNQMDVLKEKAP